MLRDVGKNCRTFSTMLMLRERSFRLQIKVIPKNMLVLLNLTDLNDLAAIVCLCPQNFTASWLLQNQRWITKWKRSRLYTAAWLKRWCPRSDWNSEWWSSWRCPSTVCLTSRCRPGFRSAEQHTSERPCKNVCNWLWTEQCTRSLTGTDEWK